MYAVLAGLICTTNKRANYRSWQFSKSFHTYWETTVLTMNFPHLRICWVSIVCIAAPHLPLFVTAEHQSLFPYRHTISWRTIQRSTWLKVRTVTDVATRRSTANKGSLMQAAVQRPSTHVRPTVDQPSAIVDLNVDLTATHLISTAERRNGRANVLAWGRVPYKVALPFCTFC